MAPYLDPHLLILLLNKIGKNEKLIGEILKSIKEKNGENLEEKENNLKKECETMLKLLNDNQLITRMRNEKNFTLKKL